MHTLSRRHLLVASAGLVGSTAFAQAGTAFPAKPVTLVMPFPPGGMFDAVLRPLINDVAQQLGQPVVLLHKPGAGGVTATAGIAAARHALARGSIRTVLCSSENPDRTRRWTKPAWAMRSRLRLSAQHSREPRARGTPRPRAIHS